MRKLVVLAMAASLAAACSGSDAGKPRPSPTTVAAEVGVDTPLGPVRQIALPEPDGCAALMEFPFSDIVGLDTSGWDNSQLSATIHGIEADTQSIDMELSPGFGLYVIRDGALVGYLPTGEYGDTNDPTYRRMTDTYLALYTLRSDRTEGKFPPQLAIEGRDVDGQPSAGGIHVDRTPSVDNCTYRLEDLPPGGM